MADTFTFPTATEAYDWAYNLPDITSQRNLLAQMATPKTMYSAMLPMLSQAFSQIGRSSLPSSSFADRLITNTVAPLWAQQATNQLIGWQNMGQQLPNLMSSYYYPPTFLTQQGIQPETEATPTTPYELPQLPAATTPTLTPTTTRPGTYSPIQRWLQQGNTFSTYRR